MQRTFKFKAWNKEENLLVRLNSIDSKKGELFKKNHILLQFTGLLDKNDSEVYEFDIVLLSSVKYLIKWDQSQLCWVKVAEDQQDNKVKLLKQDMRKSVKLCNYYESPESFIVK